MAQLHAEAGRLLAALTPANAAAMRLCCRLLLDDQVALF